MTFIKASRIHSEAAKNIFAHFRKTQYVKTGMQRNVASVHCGVKPT